MLAAPMTEPQRTGRVERRVVEGIARRAPTIAAVETVYRTKAHSVPRSVMSNDDQRAKLHAQLLAEATRGIAETYGDETSPAGRGVVQVVKELRDGRLSVLLTVAIRRRV